MVVRNILIDIGTVSLAAMTAFLFVPLFMIGANPSAYVGVDFYFWLLAVSTLLVAVGFSLIAVLVILHTVSFSRTSRWIATFALVWTVLGGFVLPVSVSAGMIDPENVPVSERNIALVSMLALAAALMAHTLLFRYVLWFSCSVILVNTLVAMYKVDDSGIWRSTSKSSLNVSETKNIFVISFDGIPGHIANSIIKESPELKSAFKDFLVFANVSSQSPSTEASMMGEVFGARDFKSIGSTVAEVLERLHSSGEMDRHPFNQIADGYLKDYTAISKNRVDIPTPDSLVQGRNSAIEFIRYGIARIFTSYTVRLISWLVPEKLLQDLRQSESSETMSRLENHVGPKWDKPYILQKQQFEQFVEGLEVSEKEISARYMHFLFTHYPVDFDRECTYRSDDVEWFYSHQNENGLEGQTECALKLFAKFLAKLKQLDIYENSLIVLKSDHGPPSDYFASPPYSLRLNGNGRWGYSRYRPMLMIKGFGTSQTSEPKVRKEFVLLNDLARTLCRQFDLNLDCEEYKGVDLLGEDLTSKEPYYVYVGRDSSSDFRFESHISVLIPSRGVPFLDAMEQSKHVSVEHPLQENDDTQQNMQMRLDDIELIRNALDSYHRRYGSYPISQGWDGRYSDFGESSPEYIKGLVPMFLQALPRDPRYSSDGTKNYLYRSDGVDFKFIVHSAPSFDLRTVQPGMVDPQRPGHAYGIWSDGATAW